VSSATRFLGSSMQLRWFQLTAKRGVDSLGRVASLAGGCGTSLEPFLEPDGRVAVERQQPVRLGIEPASKDVPRVVASVGQIGLGRAGFAADVAFDMCGFRRVHDGHVEG
jgi:hypothetical protein